MLLDPIRGYEACAYLLKNEQTPITYFFDQQHLLIVQVLYKCLVVSVLPFVFIHEFSYLKL